MILVDSSVWIAYFNGQINWQTDTLSPPPPRPEIETIS
jgi:hypothetical protein